MISHIDGVLRKKNEDELSIEVDVGGIWYEINLPAFVWRSFEDVELGTDVSLEVFHYVMERQPTPGSWDFCARLSVTSSRSSSRCRKLGRAWRRRR